MTHDEQMAAGPHLSDLITEGTGEDQRQRCEIGRHVLRKAFDDTHDWETPCPNPATVWVGGYIIEALGLCVEHADAIIAAYKRDTTR